MQKNIAIIAGSGLLPSLLSKSLKDQGHKVSIIAIQDNADCSLFGNSEYMVAALGQVQKIFYYLKSRKVTEVVLAGGIKKPSLRSLKIDSKGILFLGKIGLKMLSGGDDHILRKVICFFEEEGIKICSVQDISPSLLTPKGVLSKCSPSKSDWKDIDVGNNVLLTMGGLDIGQSVIVENENVLGVEAAEGTDKLIQRCRELKKEKKSVGVLVKKKKSAQDIRVDLPTIGQNTVEYVYQSGLKGIALGANESLIIDQKSVINLVNKYKLFLIGM